MGTEEETGRGDVGTAQRGPFRWSRVLLYKETRQVLEGTVKLKALMRHDTQCFCADGNDRAAGQVNDAEE